MSYVCVERGGGVKFSTFSKNGWEGTLRIRDTREMLHQNSKIKLFGTNLVKCSHCENQRNDRVDQVSALQSVDWR